MGDAMVQKVPQVPMFLQTTRKLPLHLASAEQFPQEIVSYTLTHVSLGDCSTLSELVDSVVVGGKGFWLQEFTSAAYWNKPLPQSQRSPQLS